MRGPRYFSVQRCLDPSALNFDSPVTVEANGAIEAAEKVLGAEVSVVGDKTRLIGRVLQLNDDYRTSAILVFEPAASVT